MFNKVALISLLSLSLIMSACATRQSAQINTLLTPQEKQQAEAAIAEAFEGAKPMGHFNDSRGARVPVGDQSFYLKFRKGNESNDTPVLIGVVNTLAFIGTLGIIPMCEIRSQVFKSNIAGISYEQSYYDCIGWLPMKQEKETISSKTLAHKTVDKILYDLFDQDYLSLSKLKR